MKQGPWNTLGPVVLALALSGCADPGEDGLSAASTQTLPLAASVKVPITASMVQVDAVRPAIGAYASLYDEQAAIGDPRAGTGAKPTTTWGNAVYNASAYPMGFVIDLGQAYQVTEVGFFDTYDTGDVHFDIGSPGAWASVGTFSSSLWERWLLIPVNQPTRYLHVTRTLYAGLNELVIYGSPVDPGANQPPVVSAGADQTVALPVSTATLTGAASDPDGTVASRQWTQVSGPNTATLANAGALTATASGLVQGTYEFQLTVTDDDGASAFARTKVTVNPAQTGRGTTTEVYKSASTPGGYGYVVYLPSGYTAGSNWPVVFFLHGMDQRGNGGSSELKKVRELGPQNYIDTKGKDYPFILVSPQADTGSTWSPYEAQYKLNPFVDHILATYKVDRRRVYMTGLSLGGGGSFSYASVYPSKLAGIVAVCPTSWLLSESYGVAHGMIAANLPIWAAHATNDGTYSIDATVSWVDQFGVAMGATGGVMSTYVDLDKTQTAFFRPATGKWEWSSGQTATDATGAGPARPVLFTVYDSGGHAIWNSVYEDPKVFDWLLAQQRP
ncbi:alpha/beta fold hydrolase [Corallococcus carmarthensis]|uniref:Alpha/beta fold hydrolase n=1 Tax=Corallococcus carmarthensis TaxID=2316728 RepID=A0A3A8KAF1_9BACT|nr:alpha/beta fold hydrolase [Corallococcus carmarthensis]RKH04970.1 alpha/beta fold hydrolase [Corallococcus carmarthensis]